MTTQAPVIGMIVISIAELMVLCLGSWLFFKQHGHTHSEAAACGISGTFIWLAGTYQVTGLSGRPQLSHWIEAAALIGAVFLIIRHYRAAWAGAAAALQTARRHPLAALGLLGGLGYLALQGILLPTDAGHWDDLGRMLVLQRRQTDSVCMPKLLETVSSLHSLPENHAILAHLFTRNHTDLGLGLLGLAAFAAIAFATYALSRRYAWPPAAMTVTLIAVSCPRFVLGASGPGTDLIPAAVGVAALLSLYRLVEHPNGLDLSFLALAACFLIGDRTLWLGFPFILMLLGALIVFRRHGVLTWVQMISHRVWLTIIVAGAALFLSRLWLYPFNGLVHGSWQVESGFSGLPLNPDGIQGAAANIIRYLLQSVDLPLPLDQGIHWLTQFSISDSLERLYTTLIAPLFGHKGAIAPFQLEATVGEPTAWFGPLCFVLLPPAFVYGMRFAPRRLKAVLVALIGYAFLVSLIIAWQPQNSRLFSVFYACSIFCIAFFLPPWRLTRTSRKLLRWAAFVLFFYTCLFNAQRPAFDFDDAITADSRPGPAAMGFGPRMEHHVRHALHNGIWMQSAWGGNRRLPVNTYFGDRRAERIADMITPDACLLIFYTDPAAAFPFLLHYRRAGAVSVSALHPNRQPNLKEIGPDYVLFADGSAPDWIDMNNWPVLWQADASGTVKPGVLLQRR